MDIILTLLISACITAVAYLLVPMVVCIIRKKLTHSQIKRLVVINGICVWLIFMIIRINAGEEGVSFAVILWSAIAYWLLKKRCLKEEIDEYEDIPGEPLQNDQPRYSLSLADEQVELKLGHVRLSDMYYDGSVDSPRPAAHTTEAAEEEPYSQAPLRKAIVGITVVVLFLISLALNVIQYMDKNSNNSPTEINRESISFEEWSDKKYNEEKLQFYDQYIVFVEDDGTNLYHTYDCFKFVKESFWAYNVDAAFENGYDPCPYCHN